jgi:hypothetical protein
MTCAHVITPVSLSSIFADTLVSQQFGNSSLGNKIPVGDPVGSRHLLDIFETLNERVLLLLSLKEELKDSFGT